MPSVRSHLEHLEADGDLQEIRTSLSPRFEISAVLHINQTKPTIIKKVEGNRFTVAGNLCPTRKHLASALQTPLDSLIDRIIAAQNNPKPAKTVGYDHRNWEVNTAADLYQLPILTHYEHDKGPYITAGMVSAQFLDTGEENLSIQRMIPISRNEAVARVVPRHLSEILKRQGDEVKVAVSIGLHPAVFLGTSLQPAYGVGEYSIVNTLLNNQLKLMNCENSNIRVPKDAEIVLEGVLSSRKLVDEGPFVDLTGTYDAIRKQPTIKFSRIHYNRNAIYQAVLPASEEHKLFMGLPQELKIWDYLKRSTPGVKAVHMTSGGAGYFHCIVSLDKSTDGDGKTAILNCFAASHPLKLVIAVDSDIDPANWNDVEFALSTRFQADTGLITIENVRGSTLDPSTGKTGVTSKLGLDTTLPIKADRTSFVKGNTILSNKTKTIITKLTGF